MPTSFDTLGLPSSLLAAIRELGFDSPTPIQAAVIPALLAGEDVVGVAQTGTGKTAAFGLPMLAAIDPSQRSPQGLVLAPTRELALQVAGALVGMASHLLDVRITAIYGGAPFRFQKRELDAGAQVVVATPGRLIDHMEHGTIDLSGLGFVVLDEGDEMLRMGFAEEVDRILSEVPPDHQTALFSATMPAEIRQTVQAHLRQPREIAVTPQSSTLTTTEQHYAVVPYKHKLRFGRLPRLRSWINSTM